MMQSIMHVIMAVKMSERHCILTDHRHLHVAHALHSSHILDYRAANSDAMHSWMKQTGNCWRS